MKDLFERNRAQLRRHEENRLWEAIREANAGRQRNMWQRVTVPTVSVVAVAVALIVVIPRMGGVDEVTHTMSRDVASVEKAGDRASGMYEQKTPGTEGEIGTVYSGARGAGDGDENLRGDTSGPEQAGQTRVESEKRGEKPRVVLLDEAELPEAMSEPERKPPGTESESKDDLAAERARANWEKLESLVEPILKSESDIAGSYDIEVTPESAPARSPKTLSLSTLSSDDIREMREKTGGPIIRGGRSGDVTELVDGIPVREEAGAKSADSFLQSSEEHESAERGIRKHQSSGDVAPSTTRPSTGGTDPVNDAPFDAMFFESAGVNPFVDTDDDNQATFAIDVDTASYNMMKAYLNRGALPPKEAIRVEEFINAFDHSYGREGFASLTPSITSTGSEGAFGIYLDAAPSHFGDGLSLVRVGLKGREITASERDPMSLTFVIDTSGSMRGGNRLGLVKQALHLLLDQLRPSDQIAIVAYGSTARVVSPMTPVRERWALQQIIDSLMAGGSTNAEEGLRVGYTLAERAYDGSRNNRVILCSDGVANVGKTGPDSILEVIQAQAGRGIYLTAIGVGMGNHNDVLLERLANQADGNYHYVDTMDDARRVFVDNMIGTLQAIARDVKIQVEFDSDVVERYRLIGYENRDVADRDFRNDAVDGGEVGAGHEVTALFEVETVDDADESDVIATVTLRYEDLANGRMTEQSSLLPIGNVRNFESTDAEFRLDAAVAEFAEILRRSYWARDGQFSEVAAVVDDVSRALPGRADVRELAGLVQRAASLWPQESGHWRQRVVPAERD